MSVPLSRRTQLAALSAVVAVALLVALAVAVGWARDRSAVAGPGRWVPAATEFPSASTSPPPGDPVASPSPVSSPTPSPAPRRASPSRRPPAPPAKKATAIPVPSHAPVPTPPPAAPPADQCTATHSGTAAALADVSAALDAAAARQYRPTIMNVAPRAISVPPTLLKAVGWQESGWQSNVVSCYHAYGVMQVIQGTADWMNGNYGTGYDLHALAGNASLGAEYLGWLIYYFGHFCFADDYDISHLDPTKPDLRDAVLAAYNLGVGAVDTKDGLVIPNRGYTNAVEGLMDAQPWAAALASASPMP
jgi:soluble lytic murein transglycosylase-like protein